MSEKDLATAPPIAALSSDPALRQVLAGISEAVASLHLVEGWDDLLQIRAREQCSIVLLDADQTEPLQLDACLAELGRLPDHPVIVVAASNDRAKELLERLDAGRIHRLLLKPATPGAARLAIDYAISRSLRTDISAAATAAPAESMRSPGRGRGPLFALGGVVVVALIGLVIWLQQPGPEAPEGPPAIVVPTLSPTPEARVAEPPALAEAAPAEPDLADRPPQGDVLEGLGVSALPAEPVVDEPTELAETQPAAVAVLEQIEAPEAAPAVVMAPREIDLLLEQGETRLEAGRLVRPLEDSAFSYYQRAAAIDGTDAGVAALRAGLGAAIVLALQETLQMADVERATELLEVAGELAISAPLVSGFALEVQTLAALQQAEQRAAFEAEILNTGLERMRAQQFIAPENDSAVFHFARLRAENPNHPGLAAPLAELAAILAAQANDAIAAEAFAAAEEWIDALRQLDTEPALAATLGDTVASARRQADFLNVPARPDELELLSFEPVSYPSLALRRGIEGWVDIDFVVSRDGLPRDIEVSAAEPSGVFDRAAINAVSRYRYAPFVYNGNVYERRLSVRLIFELD